MFTTIGAVLTGAPAGAAPQPVRRGSHLAGRCEGTFWRATSRQEVRRILLAARRFDLVGRRAGRRNGPLGHVALEVLELLGHLVRYRTGRLEPSLDYLMRTLRRSRDAIVRALQALRAHGFLDWLRRYVPTGREGRGPQLRQTSNAYRLSLPARAVRLLGLQGQPMPLPDDVLQAQAARQQEQEAYKASLPLQEFAVLEVDDTRLGQLLAQLGRHVQERESAKRAEFQAKDFT
ncbi:helix-turn-helix domain-containing protein [Rubellimicrobium roseum]|uniref:Helix-turn-helix domain-containing protein n=1 Tax=Rubellimicrobium roseum TaxID=687525 RepID=A0A5C4N721_9RHOB|nr:helix-turn-helix domain-containing protein [Rubellimicrobium roseum]TNC63115.1 helix-turn-helix domain-containing protein [Rubellimicrobium roseum]